MATTSGTPNAEPPTAAEGLQAGTVYATFESLAAEVHRLAPNSRLQASIESRRLTGKDATLYANEHPQLAKPATGRFYCRHGQDKQRGPGFFPGNKCTFSVPFSWKLNVGWSVMLNCQRRGVDCPLSVAHSHAQAVAASLATGEVYVDTAAQLSDFPDDIDTINDMSEHGVPSFRIAKYLKSKHQHMRIFDTKVIREIAFRNRGRLGTNGDQMKQFMMYAEGIARNGGCFQYGIDDSGRIRSWVLQEGAMRRYLVAYSDFILLDGTHWVNKYGQILVPPVVVSCFGRSITGAIIVAPAEESEPIIKHLAEAGLGMSDPAKKEVLMTDEGPAFPAVATAFDRWQLFCSNHFSTSVSTGLTGINAEEGTCIREDINKAIYHDFYAVKHLETHLGSMGERPEKKMQELVERLNKAKERVCTTYTKKYFTCAATSSQRSEGINSGLKHRGLFKADLKKMNLFQMAQHLVTIARTQFCKEVSDLQEAVTGNKAWGKFVNEHWELAHHNISTITKAPKEVAETIAKVVPGVDVARGCKYFQVASGNKEAPAGSLYIVTMPSARSCQNPSCTCGFYLSLKIPCKHICYTLIHLGRSVFDKGNLHPRWLVTNNPQYGHAMQISGLCSGVPANITEPAPTQVQVPAPQEVLRMGSITVPLQHYHQVKVVSSAARYTMLVQKASVLAKIGASAGADKFKKVMAAMDALKNFLEADVDDVAEVQPGLGAPQPKQAPTSKQDAVVADMLNSIRGKNSRKTAPAGKEAPGPPARNTAGASKRAKGVTAKNSKMGQCKMCKAHGLMPLDGHRTGPSCPTWTGCNIEACKICSGIKFGKHKRQPKAGSKASSGAKDSDTDSDSDEQEVYEVERILGKRLEENGLEYQVHWKGYTKEYDTWEPANSLGDSQAAVAAYEKGKPKSPK